MENEKRSGAPGAVSPEELREAAAQLKKMAKLEESMARAEYLEENLKPVRRTGDAGSRKPMDEKRSGAPGAERTDMGSGFVHQVFLDGPAAAGPTADEGTVKAVPAAEHAAYNSFQPEEVRTGCAKAFKLSYKTKMMAMEERRAELVRALEHLPVGITHLTVEIFGGVRVHLYFEEPREDAV